MRVTGPDALSFELHYAVDLAESDLIDRVQSWLAGPGRAFCHDLRVLAYERDRTALPVNVDVRGSLHEAVIAKGSERGATYRALVASDLRPTKGDSGMPYCAARRRRLS